MGNIVKIFMTDIRKLLKNIFALIIVIGICAIPSLYAWFNIYSNWDPYANTANIKIAVATEDKDYTQEDGTVVNMGDEVIEELKENHSIGWVFTDKEDALKGVDSGDYYAAIAISPDFTYSMYNVLKQNFESPTIVYYENEKKNAVATKITDSAISTLKSSLNKKFVEVAAKTVFEKTNSLNADTKSKDTLSAFIEQLMELNTNIESYNNMIDTFLSGNEKLVSAVQSANGQIPNLQRGITDTAGSLGYADSSLKDSRASLSDFSNNLQDTLDSVQTSLNNLSYDISNAKLAQKAQDTADSVKKTTDDAKVLAEQLNALNNSLTELNQKGNQDPNTQKQVSQALETIKSLTGNTGDLQSILNSMQAVLAGSNTSDSSIAAGDLVQSKVDMVTNALQNCSKSVEDMKNLYKNNLQPEMDNLLNSMSGILGNVTNILNSLNNTLGDMTTIFGNASNTIDNTDKSLAQIKTVLASVSDKLKEVIDKVNGAEDDKKVQTLLSVLGGDPETYGEFFAQPVEVNSKQIYQIANYGSAVAPFYTILAIWVGALVLVAIIKVKAEPKNMKNLKSYQLFWGRYLLFYVLGQIQAGIIVFGNIFFLHTQILNPFLYWLAASLASMTFTLLIYSLTLSFGDIGKAIAVIMMVIQIAGSGGTYPIEILPSFYRNVYIFFPFPYAINALRETIGGMYGSAYEKSLLIVLLFAVVAVLIGMVIRIPFIGINHFVEKRMKDTKMM